MLGEHGYSVSRMIAVSSALGGLAAVFEALPFDVPFPPYPRITFDPSGIPIVLSLLMTGFIPSVYTTLIGASMIFYRGNIFGGIFKIIAELSTLVGLQALIKKKIYLSSISSLATRITIMTVANYFLLPLFYGLPLKIVVPLLPLIAIFNLIQGALNIGIAYIIYVRIPPTLKIAYLHRPQSKKLVRAKV